MQIKNFAYSLTMSYTFCMPDEYRIGFGILGMIAALVLSFAGSRNLRAINLFGIIWFLTEASFLLINLDRRRSGNEGFWAISQFR